MENEKIQELEKRIVQLEKEVKHLKQDKGVETKNEMKLEPLKKKIQPEKKEPVFVSSEKQSMEKSMEKPQTEAATSTKNKQVVDWESLIGKVWLPRIFIFVLLLGIVWGFKIAVDAGFLNETARIFLGFIIAGVFYFFGSKQMEKNRFALGIVLFVGSITTLMVTTFAMNVLYGMIPSTLAFVLNLVWVGVGINLANRYHSQTMGTMFAIAGYLIPFLTAGSGTETTLTMVIGYELLYYIALLGFAIRKQYRILFYVSSVFLHIVYLMLVIASLAVITDVHLFLMTLGILVQHEGLFFKCIKGKLENMKGFPALFSSFVVTMLWASMGLETYDPVAVYHLFTIYLVATTIRYGLIAYQAKLNKNSSILTLASVIATMGLTLFILDVVENNYLLISSFLVEGALAFYIGTVFRSEFQKVMGLIIFYLTAFWMLGIEIFHVWSLFVWVLLIGTLYFLVMFTKKTMEQSFYIHLIVLILVHFAFLVALPYGYGLLSLKTVGWIAVIGSLYYLYQVTKEGTHEYVQWILVGVNVILHLAFIAHIAENVPIQSTNVEVFSLTIGWAFYALACVYIGMIKQKKPLRLLGIGLIFLTLFKLIFLDLAFISVITRSFLFVIIGAIGILLSRFVYGNK